MELKTILDKLFIDIQDAGYSVARVSRLADIDDALVCRWKHGKVEPRISSINKMYKALNQLKENKVPQYSI